MKNITRNHAINLLTWFKSYGDGNWGGWGNYPSLPVGANYLQFDTNKCQINLDKPIIIGDLEYNCITNGRTVGKNKISISFYELQSLFEIKNEDIEAALNKKELNRRAEWVKWQLAAQSKFLYEKDDYAPRVVSIEKIFLKKEITGAKFIAPLGKVLFCNSQTDLEFTELVEWEFVRYQGKNGRNKKIVFAPISIPSHIQTEIDSHLEKMRILRVKELKKRVENYSIELSLLTNENS